MAKKSSNLVTLDQPFIDPFVMETLEQLLKLFCFVTFKEDI